MFNKAELIKESVSMDDVLRDFAGIENKRRRSAQCPINGCEGHDGFSWTKNVFHCFICDAKGDVIGFVMQLLNCDFKSACRAINQKYRLYDDEGWNGGLGEQRCRELSERVEKRRQERRKELAKKKKRDKAIDELNRLDANKIKYAPKSPDDELDPRYIEACQKLPMQQYIVDCME